MADLFHNWKTRKITVQIIKLTHVEFFKSVVAQMSGLGTVGRRSSGSGEGAKMFCAPHLPSTAGLCLQHCSQTSCGACQLSWRVASQWLPSALEQRRQHRCSCLGTAQCQGWKEQVGSCALASISVSQSFWCAGKQVPGNFGVAEAENQVRASSCRAPAAVPRKNALIQQF